MILGLFRRSANAVVIDRLHGAVAAAARDPALYAGLAIPDTFEGRFECLTLHAVLVLRRLRDAPPPGPDMAQHLVDTVFRHFDRTLREMGVGDMAVPKRMRTMAEAFTGRCAAYGNALQSGSLAQALARNVYGGCHDGVALSRYVLDCAARLADAPLQAFEDGALPLPDPVAYVVPREPERRIPEFKTVPASKTVPELKAIGIKARS